MVERELLGVLGVREVDREERESSRLDLFSYICRFLFPEASLILR